MGRPVEWLERRLTLVEGYAQETARRFPGTCWPSDAVQVMAFGAAEFVEDVAAPENMLRLAAGARALLGEHVPTPHAGYMVCHECSPLSPADAGVRTVSRLYPCRTVLLLAQAWGWEEEQRG